MSIDNLDKKKFKQIKAAYEILSDQKKRAAYDQFGHAGVDPTMDDTFTQIDKWYNESNNEKTYDKQGSIILGLNDTFSVRLTSTGTGEAVCRVTFMMMDKDRG